MTTTQKMARLGGALIMIYALLGSTLGNAQEAPKPKVDYEAWFNNTMKDNYFDTAATRIRPDAHEVLSSDATALKQHPNINFVIQGHTDERGSNAYNDRLSARRAAVTKNFLLAHGVSAGQISTVGEGKRQPVCSEHDEDCWQKNRRAHLVFSSATN